MHRENIINNANLESPAHVFLDHSIGKSSMHDLLLRKNLDDFHRLAGEGTLYAAQIHKQKRSAYK